MDGHCTAYIGTLPVVFFIDPKPGIPIIVSTVWASSMPLFDRSLAASGHIFVLFYAHSDQYALG